MGKFVPPGFMRLMPATCRSQSSRRSVSRLGSARLASVSFAISAKISSVVPGRSCLPLATAVTAMRLLKRKDTKADRGGTAVANGKQDLPGTTEEIFAEIAKLTDANRAEPSRETERRLLWLRHVAGISLSKPGGTKPDFPAPAADRLPTVPSGLPEIARADLTPELLRAGILRDGCLLVRGLVDRDEALRFAGRDRPCVPRARHHDGGGKAAEGYYEEFHPDAAFGMAARSWVQGGRRRPGRGLPQAHVRDARDLRAGRRQQARRAATSARSR